MLPNRIRRALIFFDACGYNTGSTGLTKRRKISFSIVIVHISLAIFFTIWKFHILDKLRPIFRVIELVNHLLQYSSAMYTYWFIVLDSLLQWREHRQFWQNLEVINKSFFPQCNFTFRVYLFKFITHVLMVFVPILIIILVNEMDVGNLVIVHVLLAKFCHVRVFYYLFCIESMHFQLKILQNACKEMSRSRLRDTDSQRLKWMREYHHCVHNMANDLNQVFGWSQVATISFCFYNFLTDLNWLCVHFNDISATRTLGKFNA